MAPTGVHENQACVKPTWARKQYPPIPVRNGLVGRMDQAAKAKGMWIGWCRGQIKADPALAGAYQSQVLGYPRYGFFGNSPTISLLLHPYHRENLSMWPELGVYISELDTYPGTTNTCVTDSIHNTHWKHDSQLI